MWEGSGSHPSGLTQVAQSLRWQSNVQIWLSTGAFHPRVCMLSPMWTLGGDPASAKQRSTSKGVSTNRHTGQQDGHLHSLWSVAVKYTKLAKVLQRIGRKRSSDKCMEGGCDGRCNSRLAALVEDIALGASNCSEELVLGVGSVECLDVDELIEGCL